MRKSWQNQIRISIVTYDQQKWQLRHATLVSLSNLTNCLACKHFPTTTRGLRVTKEAYFNSMLNHIDPSTRKNGSTELHIFLIFFFKCNFRAPEMETVSENLSYDRLTTSSQRTGFHAQHPAHIGDVTENDWKASRAAVAIWAGFGRGTNPPLPHNPIVVHVILTHPNFFICCFSVIVKVLVYSYTDNVLVHTYDLKEILFLWGTIWCRFFFGTVSDSGTWVYNYVIV